VELKHLSVLLRREKLDHIIFFFLQIVPASAIPDGWMGLDIGPDSVASFNAALDTTKTVIWNGPMGVFEFDKFAVGTEVKHCSNTLIQLSYRTED
jgi:3-phosphoglycerate kinase